MHLQGIVEIFFVQGSNDWKQGCKAWHTFIQVSLSLVYNILYKCFSRFHVIYHNSLTDKFASNTVTLPS